MKRLIRKPYIPLVVAGLLSLSKLNDLGAQVGPGTPQAGLSREVTPLETEILRLVGTNELLTARTKAEWILRGHAANRTEPAVTANPNSWVANYAMGVVQREAEGSFPKAMQYLGRARELYEQTFGGCGARPGAPWERHREILNQIQSVAQNLEEFQYQLEILQYHDACYSTMPLMGERAWPLMRLGRFDEARIAARAAAAMTDPWEHALGLGNLCAVESEARSRQDAYTACNAALENARQRIAQAAQDDPNIPHLAVHTYNAALAALASLHHDEAVQMLTESTRRAEYTVANPWQLLAHLYITQGKAGEAATAIRNMQNWRLRQPASTRDQVRAQADSLVATFLLMAGEPRAGIRMISRAIERPDREGSFSNKPEQTLGGNALIRRSLQRMLIEMNAEQSSSAGFTTRIQNVFSTVADQATSWPDDELVTNILAEDTRLASTLRIYVNGGIGGNSLMPVWLLGDLVDVLGAGVVSVALREARSQEHFPGMTAYYDAIETDVAFAQGDYRRTIDKAQAAIRSLPQAEVLLIARVAALGAEAAWREGQNSVAMNLFEISLQKDPGAIRRLGLSIPVTFTGNGSGAIGEAIQLSTDLLRRSPRLREASGGFSVAFVTPTPNVIRVCLQNRSNAEIGCTNIPARNGQSTDQWAQKVAETFHRDIFALRSALIGTDLRSLDGSTATSRDATRLQTQQILDELSRQGE